MKIRVLSYAVLFCLPLLSSPAAAQEHRSAGVTLILVRHAETADDDRRDPSLNEAGRSRAESLAETLEYAAPVAIYVTQYRRTQQTAEALATRSGAPVVLHPVRSADLEEFAAGLLERIGREHGGQTVVIVGHSNTVPAIVRAATGAPIEDLAHETYDRMYIVRLGTAESVLVQARY